MWSEIKVRHTHTHIHSLVEHGFQVRGMWNMLHFMKLRNMLQILPHCFIDWLLYSWICNLWVWKHTSCSANQCPLVQFSWSKRSYTKDSNNKLEFHPTQLYGCVLTYIRVKGYCIWRRLGVRADDNCLTKLPELYHDYWWLLKWLHVRAMHKWW